MTQPITVKGNDAQATVPSIWGNCGLRSMMESMTMRTTAMISVIDCRADASEDSAHGEARRRGRLLDGLLHFIGRHLTGDRRMLIEEAARHVLHADGVGDVVAEDHGDQRQCDQRRGAEPRSLTLANTAAGS